MPVKYNPQLKLVEVSSEPEERGFRQREYRLRSQGRARGGGTVKEEEEEGAGAREVRGSHEQKS